MDLAPFPGSGGSTGWRLILGIGAVPALIAVVLRSRMPESPRWLMRHGKYEEMRDALGILGVSASTDEIRDTARHLEAADARSEGKGLSRWTPGIKRALIVVCVFFVFQQITGINVPLYYGPKLLGSLFQSGGSQVASTVAGVEVTAIMTAVNVAATFIAFKLIDRAGRRKLAMSGYAGMLLSAVLAGAGLGLLAGTAKIVVVAIALDAFIASFAAGVGGTGWVLQGEVFPTWESGIGLGWVLICFAALCVMAIAFVFWFLPETKGHSVEEIVGLFERQRLTAGEAARG